MFTGYIQSRIFALAAVVAIVAAANFDECIGRIHQMPNTTIGGRDNKGNPAPIFNATAITYDLCVQECGADPEPFAWTVFSQQFSSWLLPWLALISQLPFGANNKMSNLQSMLLTVGSPVLATYSLTLTTLNGHWVTRRFRPFKQHPHASRAVRALSRLQQAPLRITHDHHLLSALVHLRENRQWWDELLSWLNLTHSWSISAATSIAWVFIAYIFTVVDSLTGSVVDMVNANSQGVGSIWLWLLAVVVGWLQISPKCDSVHLDHSLGRANKLAFTSSGEPLSEVDTGPAIYLSIDHSTLRCDEGRSPPIFNYARLFSWVEAVEQVADAFRAPIRSPKFTGSLSSQSHYRDDSEPASESNMFLMIPLRHRKDSTGGLYMGDDGIQPRMYQRWGEGTWQRILVSSGLALFLQWGTTGAALVVVWYTPTKGLGCRSLAYVGYGVISTLVWAALLISSILSHYSVTTKPQRALSNRLARGSAILLRRLGKCLAAINGIGLVVVCVLQFSNFFDRCFCNSSVFTLGGKAYDVIIFLEEDIQRMRNAWIGGVVLAGVSTIIFYVFINIFVNPLFPDHNCNEHD